MRPIKVAIFGGDKGIRTPGLYVANVSLYQLSHAPKHYDYIPYRGKKQLLFANIFEKVQFDYCVEPYNSTTIIIQLGFIELITLFCYSLVVVSSMEDKSLAAMAFSLSSSCCVLGMDMVLLSPTVLSTGRAKAMP